MNLINRPYTSKNILVDRKNVSQFVRPAWHRDMRQSHIDRIRNSLLDNNHFSENVTVNEKDGRMYVINGNHRMQALKEAIKVNSDLRIEITATIYKNLSREEELELYTLINNTKKETGLDRLKSHLHGSYIYNAIEKDFPIKLTYSNINKAQKNIMTAGNFFNAYINRESTKPSMSNVNLIKHVKELGEKDYEKMKRFARFIQMTLGEPSIRNVLCRYNIVSAVAKIYFLNVGMKYTEQEMKEELQKVISNNLSTIIAMSMGVQQMRMLYEFIIDGLPKRRKLYTVMQQSSKETEAQEI